MMLCFAPQSCAETGLLLKNAFLPLRNFPRGGARDHNPRRDIAGQKRQRPNGRAYTDRYARQHDTSCTDDGMPIEENRGCPNLCELLGDHRIRQGRAAVIVASTVKAHALREAREVL